MGQSSILKTAKIRPLQKMEIFPSFQIKFTNLVTLTFLFMHSSSPLSSGMWMKMRLISLLSYRSKEEVLLFSTFIFIHIGFHLLPLSTTKNKWSTHEHSHPHPATQRARSGFGCTPRACTSTHPTSTRPTRRSEVRSECDARAQRVARKDGGGEAVVPFLSVSIK